MYKTILVHVDASAKSAHAIDAAARLALRHDAHLVGNAATGLSAYFFPAAGPGAEVPAILFPIEEMRAEAARALDAFESAVRLAGVSTFERRCSDQDAGVGLCLQSRYADLVVIGQRVPEEFLIHLRPEFPEFVLLNCARPVLVVPADGIQGEFGKRVAVAWNGSAEAVRAITSAISLLRAAEQVKLVVFNAQAQGGLHGEEPGADMALYLARHGIRVEVAAAETGLEPGEALLAFARDSGMDMIVMGAYGHSRFREIVLGGTTRIMLRSSPLPLWMAH